jgi:hypothetical protein
MRKGERFRRRDEASKIRSLGSKVKEPDRGRTRADANAGRRNGFQDQNNQLRSQMCPASAEKGDNVGGEWIGSEIAEEVSAMSVVDRQVHGHSQDAIDTIDLICTADSAFSPTVLLVRLL